LRLGSEALARKRVDNFAAAAVEIPRGARAEEVPRGGCAEEIPRGARAAEPDRLLPSGIGSRPPAQTRSARKVRP